MKAVRAHAWCEPKDLKIDEIEKPAAKAGETLIKVNSAALNFPDVLLIAGKYQVKPPLPFSPGLEVAGTVESLGEGVNGFKMGQRVFANIGYGGFSEYVAAPSASVKPTPESMSDDEAAAFPLVYQTSYFGIAYRGALKPGESVLVHSAAGGVGMSAVQIARALGAGKIFGTVGSDDKLDLVKKLGADVAINYEKEDWVEIVKSETGGAGVDVVYDPVGGEVGEKSAKCIAFEGRIVIIGFTSGKFSNFASNHILIKNYSVVGLHWGNYRFKNPAIVEQAWAELFALQKTGKLKPVIGGRFKMDKVADAMELLKSRKAVGKIVLNW